VAIDAQTGTSYSIPITDDVSFLTGSNSGATAWTGFALANHYVFSFMNLGAGLITYTPASGPVNGNATQIIPHNWFGFHYTDNTSTYMPVLPSIAAFPNCLTSLNFTSATGAFSCNASPTFVAPVLGTATATSLLASGIVDGKAPVTITTGSSATLGGTYKSGYTFNAEATAATAVTYTLPTAAAGLQYCVSNINNGSAATTGTLSVSTSASGQYIDDNGTLSASGGYIISGGAAGDSGCVVGESSTVWKFYTQSPPGGTWSLH
jgi:hypothetical protein